MSAFEGKGQKDRSVATTYFHLCQIPDSASNSTFEVDFRKGDNIFVVYLIQLNDRAPMRTSATVYGRQITGYLRINYSMVIFSQGGRKDRMETYASKLYLQSLWEKIRLLLLTYTMLSMKVFTCTVFLRARFEVVEESNHCKGSQYENTSAHKPFMNLVDGHYERKIGR